MCVWVAFAILSAGVFGCETDKTKASAGGDANVITVFAASSLVGALPEIARLFEKQHSVVVRTSFAASSMLARQIAAGAPAGVFISADPRWMDYLAKANGIDTTTRIDILANRLVLVMPTKLAPPGGADGRFLVEGFDGRVALGDPDLVPAGRYAKEALTHFGIWQTLQPRLIPTLDVRAALRLVVTGETDAAIVYLSDARSEPRVAVAMTYPLESHSPIRYSAAGCRDAGALATTFLKFLSHADARRIFEQHGFEAVTAK